ncbi:MAG: hypothetical protein ACI8UO_006592, partial [Verrucomicrobiales bacterium]
STEIGIAGLPPMGGAPKLQHKVFHGPMAMTPDGVKFCAYYMISTLDLSDFPEVAEKVKDVFGDNEALVIKTTMGLSGPKSIEIEVPAATYSMPGPGGQMTFDFGGIEGIMTDYFAFNFEETTGKIDIDVKKLTVSAEDGTKFQFDGATMTSEATNARGELLLAGTGSVVVPSITMSSEGQTFRMKGFTVESNQSENGGSISADGSISFDEITVPPIFGGDEVVLKDAALKFGFNGLSVEAIEKLMAVQKEMVESGGVQGFMGDSTELFGPLFELIQPGAGAKFEAGLGLFEMGPVKVVDAKVTYEIGEKDGNVGASNSYSVASVSLPDSPDMAPFQEMLADGASVSTEIHGLSTAAIQELIGQGRTVLEATMSGEFNGSGPDEETMMKSAMDIIQKGTGFGVTAKLGDNSADLLVNYASSESLMELKTLKDLVSALAGHLEVKVDRSLIPPDANDFFAPLVEQKFIIEGPDFYSTSIKLDNGNLNFNGNEIKAEEFLGPGANQPLPWAMRGSSPPVF